MEGSLYHLKCIVTKSTRKEGSASVFGCVMYIYDVVFTFLVDIPQGSQSPGLDETEGRLRDYSAEFGERSQRVHAYVEPRCGVIGEYR